MEKEYYVECFKRYADSSEEDAVKVQRGAVKMMIIDSIVDDPNDKVAHQASIILGLNLYRNDKDAYAQEVCYGICTADCEIQKAVDRCIEIIHHDGEDELEDDISILIRLLMVSDKQSDREFLGYISEELQRSFLVHEKPDYEQLESNIDYILYDLLDVLDLTTEESKEYVYKHREQLIRPIMDIALSTGDIMLMEQMRQVYKNWMEWR